MRKGALLGGRYKLERRLGSGGMAAVWAAHDERLDRAVAVKVLSDVLASEPDYVERFDREARTAAALSHPGLVGIYDYGSDDDRPYLVMDLVDGPSLAQVLSSRKRADDLDPERLARELLEALGHVHAGGVIHRDIKPGNVLIDPDGRARMTDFGIAQPHDASRLTRTGHVIGTREYMAPEVAAGKPATKRSDLYSLGVLLAEVAGDPPPASLQPLIDSLTRESPRQRPGSAEAALKLIGGGAGDEPAQATTEPMTRTAPTVKLPQTARRMGQAAAANPRRGLAALGALILVVGLIALAAGGGGGESAKDQSTVAEPTTPEPTTAPAVEEEAGGGPPPGKGPAGDKGKGKGKAKGHNK